MQSTHAMLRGISHCLACARVQGQRAASEWQSSRMQTSTCKMNEPGQAHMLP